MRLPSTQGHEPNPEAKSRIGIPGGYADSGGINYRAEKAQPDRQGVGSSPGTASGTIPPQPGKP